MEDNFFVERLQRGNAVDAAEIGATTKDEAGVFLQNELLPAADQSASNFQLSLIAPLFASVIARWRMLPILGISSTLIASELFQKSKPLTLP